MKLIITILLLISLGAYSGVLPDPVNGCTFYKHPFSKSFDDCAQFNVIEGGCTKTKCAGFACFTYSANLASMYIPDFLIEVTNGFGESLYTEKDLNPIIGITLKEHLNSAKKYWKASDPLSIGNIALPSGISDIADSLRSGDTMGQGDQFQQVRILTIPGAAAVTVYPSDIYRRWFSSSAGIPVCFEAISEFFPHQWRDNLVDGAYSMTTIPVSYPLCSTLIGSAGVGASAALNSAMNEITGLTLSGPNLPISAQCSYPTNVKSIATSMLSPRSDAWAPLKNPANFCIGSYGELFPRTGTSLTDDPHSASLIAAIRFASLSGDTYLSHKFKVNLNDKIQQVYPRPSELPLFGALNVASCSKPRNPLEGLASITNPMSAVDTLRKSTSSALQTSDLIPGIKRGSYIYAVWKKRTSCEEPWITRAILKQAYEFQKTLHTNKCQLMGNL